MKEQILVKTPEPELRHAETNSTTSLHQGLDLPPFPVINLIVDAFGHCVFLCEHALESSSNAMDSERRAWHMVKKRKLGDGKMQW